MEVELIHWPDDKARLQRARRDRTPRLVLVDDGEAALPPPVPLDTLEDWVRLPASDGDVRARVRVLEVRAEQALRPALEEGVLRFGSDWVALSPVESLLVGPLMDKFGTVVGRDALVKAAWPEEPPQRNALDVHVLRLRRRLEQVGLEIRTVRSRGYLLQPAS